MQQEWLIPYCLLLHDSLSQSDASDAFVASIRPAREEHCWLGTSATQQSLNLSLLLVWPIDKLPSWLGKMLG